MDPSLTPLAPNPDGSPPDFMSGPSLAPVNVAIGSIIIALSAIIVTLRLYASYKHIGRLSLDDCFCLGSEVAVLVYWGLLTAELERGIGRHASDLPVSVVSSWVLKRHVVSQFFGATGNWLSKASILAFFIRVFGSLRWVRIACYALFVLLSMGAITHIGLFAVLCVPHGHEIWDFKLMMRCGTGAPVTVAVGACTLLIDIAIFILPFPIISSLNMDKNKKRGLIIVFLIGFAIIVTSTVGLAYRIIVMNSTDDPTWNGANVSITAYVDTFGTIIVSCAPGVYSWWLKIFSQSRLYSSLRSMSLLRPRSFSVTPRDYVLKERENSPTWSHREQYQYKLPEIVTSSPQPIGWDGSQRDDRNVIPVSTVISQTISDRVESYESGHQAQEYPWQSTDAKSSRAQDSRYV